MAGLICAGNVQIAILNEDGSSKGFMPVKNTVQLQIANGDNNEKTRVSKQIESFGQALDTVYTPGASVLTIGVDEHDADIAGMSFRGEVTQITRAAQTAVKATVAFAAAGTWFPISEGAYNLTDVAVKALDDEGEEGAGLVLDKDYKLDAEGGMIMKVVGGAAGDSVEVTFSAPAQTGVRVTPGTKPTLRARIYGKMKNLATGKFIYVNIPEAALYPSSEVDFLADSFAVATFGGPIKSVDGKPPFTVDYL